MPSTRNKIARCDVENGIATITFYTDPAAGPQQPAGQLTFNGRDTSFADHMTLDNLVCVGFGSVLAQRYSNSEEHPNVPAIFDKLVAELKSGDWQPGRAAPEREPTLMQRAVAEAMGAPIDEVMERWESELQRTNNGEIYRDSAGKPRRVFNQAFVKQLETDKDIGPIYARLLAEQAKHVAADSKKSQRSVLGNLFHKNGEPAAAQ